MATAFQSSAFQNNAFQIDITSTVDTHDGGHRRGAYKKKHRINLPVYIKEKLKPKEVQALEEILEDSSEIETLETITPAQLIEHEIDWQSVVGYAKNSSKRIDIIMAILHKAQLEYEFEEDFMMLAIAAAQA